MSLKSQLMDDMKQAMRDRNSQKLSTIRFLLSEIKNTEIDSGEQDDAGIENIITKQVKQMKDAQLDFKSAGREDLVEEEQQKIAVLETYLPEQMTEEQVQAVVNEVIAEQDSPNMGSVIKAVKEKVGNSADGGMIAAVVKKSL